MQTGMNEDVIKNTLTIIPSAQIDFGHTIFDSYKETGISAMSFKKQHVKSRNLRAAIAAVDKIENEKYSIIMKTLNYLRLYEDIKKNGYNDTEEKNFQVNARNYKCNKTDGFK